MSDRSPRFVFITGGVASSLGKGLSAAALASVLQLRGFKVRMRKLDPYLNVDPGTMRPQEHGECYVTDDGAETDLDLGHYERFTDVDTRKSDNVTSGRIYKSVIDKERSGEFYDGKTVQVVPHVTDEIKEFIAADLSGEDFVLCEIGGTVGDIEGLPFLEAIRQFGLEYGAKRSCFMHLTLVPYLSAAGELKTKPTQHSVKELQSFGIRPDILICRSEKPINDDNQAKIARFCSVKKSAVIPALDKPSIYLVPRALHEEGLDQAILDHFDLEAPQPDLSQWDRIAELKLNPPKVVKIAVVGKYVEHQDAYKSLREAIDHGGFANEAKVMIEWVDSELLEQQDVAEKLKDVSAVLVPGGFGVRGTEGKIKAITYARESKVPFLGICLGMQMAAVEFTRNVLGEANAGSTEMDPQCLPVVGFMHQWNAEQGTKQRSVSDGLGGTMRLGAYECELLDGTLAHKVYGETPVFERHRHRYEINMSFKQRWADKGMILSGQSPDAKLPEIMELEDHPWFIGVQFHPELKSRPTDSHPLFSAFIQAALKQQSA